jgi:hypothetical protein
MLDQDLSKPRPPMGAKPMTADQIEQHRRWRQSLTWRDKLRLAVEEWRC